MALDFAGPFQNAKKGKTYLLVSVDHFSGWSDAKVLHRPTTKEDIEFSKQYIAQYEVPKKKRRDPDTVFINEAFIQFFEQLGIKQITYPVRDHRVNGKIEQLIRTINEQLRLNKQFILSKDKSGLSAILYSLRISKKRDGKLPFERHMGKGSNTAKSNLVGKFRDFSAQDSHVECQPSDFQDETDSAILVRERTKDSKLETAFARKTRKVLQKTEHIIALIQEKAKRAKVFSKRDCMCFERAKGDV